MNDEASKWQRSSRLFGRNQKCPKVRAKKATVGVILTVERLPDSANADVL